MDGGLEGFKTSINLSRRSRNQTRKLIASGLPRDYLDSELKILEGNSGDIILNFKKVTEPYSVRNIYLMIKR